METLLADFINISKANDGNEFVRQLFGHHFNAVLQRERPLILFGTGDVGQDLCEVLQYHDIFPDYFVDNNPIKAGLRYHGVKTINIEHLKGLDSSPLIIISTQRFEKEIRQQLLENGFSLEQIISVSNLKSLELLRYYKYTSYYTQNPSHLLNNDDLIKDNHSIVLAYSLLSDTKSQEIFRDRLALFLEPMDFMRFSDYVCRHSELNEAERDTFDFYVSPEDYGYFMNDCLKLEEDEVLVDAGAYNGLTAATFAECCRRMGINYRKIISFEPNPTNFKLTEKTCRQLRDATCVPAGLWSGSTTLDLVSFAKEDPTAFLQACANQTVSSSTALTSIRTVSLDEYFPSEKVTFIKMDIEGAEPEALVGAKNLIRRCRPKLAISADYRHSDLYNLPILINEIAPGYTFYLRHYAYTLFDTVLFAIPDAQNAATRRT